MYGRWSLMAKKNGIPPIAISNATDVFCHTADEDTIPRSTAMARPRDGLSLVGPKLSPRPSVISRPARVHLFQIVNNIYRTILRDCAKTKAILLRQQ